MTSLADPRAFSTVANAVAHAEYVSRGTLVAIEVSAYGKAFHVHHVGLAHPCAQILLTITPDGSAS